MVVEAQTNFFVECTKEASQLELQVQSLTARRSGIMGVCKVQMIVIIINIIIIILLSDSHLVFTRLNHLLLSCGHSR